MGVYSQGLDGIHRSSNLEEPQLQCIGKIEISHEAIHLIDS